MLHRDGDVPSSLWQKEDARVVEGLCEAPRPKPWPSYRFKGVVPAEVLAKAGKEREGR